MLFSNNKSILDNIPKNQIYNGINELSTIYLIKDN